jgi:hypothetical protein
MELALTLSGYGFAVKCIAISKLENFVPGTRGGALYLTDHGDFDVVFLPKAQTFDAFRVVERHKNGQYVYLFRGNPRKKGRMEGKRTYFFRNSNKLFIAWDKRTATNLSALLVSH